MRPKLVACCNFHHALIDVNCDDITIDHWQAVNRLDGYDGTLLRDQRRLQAHHNHFAQYSIVVTPEQCDHKAVMPLALRQVPTGG